MSSFRILAFVKVSHLMMKPFFRLLNIFKRSTRERASTRPSTRKRKVNGHPHYRCTSAVWWSMTGQCSQINDFCLRDKEIQFGNQEERKKGKLSHLMLFSLHLSFFLFCSASFILPFHLFSFVSALPHPPCFA